MRDLTGADLFVLITYNLQVPAVGVSIGYHKTNQGE